MWMVVAGMALSFSAQSSGRTTPEQASFEIRLQRVHGLERFGVEALEIIILVFGSRLLMSACTARTNWSSDLWCLCCLLISTLALRPSPAQRLDDFCQCRQPLTGTHFASNQAPASSFAVSA